MPTDSLVTLDEAIEEVERVIRERRAFYPREVQSGVLAKTTAYRRIAIMEYIGSQLRGLREQNNASVKDS